MAGYDGLNPQLASAVQQMIADSPYPIGISSGFRTRQQQQVLYDRYLRGEGALAARPGSSNHESGNAVDLQYGNDQARQWVQANAARYGLHFPVRGENWHAELAGGDNRPNAGLDNEAMRFNVGAGSKPEDVLSARLEAIMSAIEGRAPQDTAFAASLPDFDMATAPAGGAATMTATKPVQYQKDAGVEQWRPLVAQALQYVGEAPSEANIAMTLRRMDQESDGNPTIVNNWDVNARHGDPSVGLMQVIGSTFNKYAGELRDRGQTDPFANLVASMRYAKARYGSLAAAYTRRGGY